MYSSLMKKYPHIIALLFSVLKGWDTAPQPNHNTKPALFDHHWLVVTDPLGEK